MSSQEEFVASNGLRVLRLGDGQVRIAANLAGVYERVLWLTPKEVLALHEFLRDYLQLGVTWKWGVLTKPSRDQNGYVVEFGSQQTADSYAKIKPHTRTLVRKPVYPDGKWEEIPE